MRNLSRPVLLSLITLAASVSTGCGKKDGKTEGKIGACDRIEAESLCVQFGAEHFSAMEEESLRDHCTEMKGKFSLAACPAASQIGTCANPEGAKIAYSTGGFPLSVEDAKKHCGEDPWKPAN
jgi:hypothetical protein